MRNTVIVGLSFALIGCSGARNSAICQLADPPAIMAEYAKHARSPDKDLAFGANVGLADACVLKTARLLARAPDPAHTVASAVVAQCEDRISAYADAMKAQTNPPGMAAVPFSEITTGKEVSAEERAFARMRRRALAAVVEARAGNCFD